MDILHLEFKRKREFLWTIVLLSIIVFAFWPASRKLNAAMLYFSPSSGDFSVGNIINIDVLVNTGGVAINNAEVSIAFPTDLLSVVSISKTNSIFSLWVEEPSFSNNAGLIILNGGLPTPGFTGTAGKILSIIFRAKKEGTVSVLFSSAAVRANDGLGTNILTNIGGGSYTLSAREISPVSPGEEEYIPPSTPGQTPAAPVVSSLTHPDPEKWYSNNSPEFNWRLPSDATGVSLLLHKNAIGDPGSISDGLIESKKFENVEDGIWYFHIKFRNGYGWGEITHRKFLIDTRPPEPFSVIIDNKNDATNPCPAFLFEATDSLSGIEYYEVKINGEKATTTPQNIKDNPYQPLPLAPGKYDVEVKAYDKAGNNTSALTEFEISPIKGVEITKIPISIRIGETLEIEGKAEPEITVRIYIQKLEKEPVLEKVKADLTGKFVLSYDKSLSKGDYVVWAQAEDKRGALSEPTKKYELEVGLPAFLKFGKIAIDYLTTMITLIILIVGAFAVIFYTWYRVSLWRKKLRRETKEVDQAVSSAFKTLREEVQEQIEYLDGKPGVTKGEKKVRDKLKEALDISEQFIEKEIKDVEKELE